jgi:hypothetical protein
MIADIALAPCNAASRVEAMAGVVILHPADLSRGSGTLLLDVPNRGRKLALQLFDDPRQPGANNAQAASDAGIGFLHGQGMTLVGTVLRMNLIRDKGAWSGGRIARRREIRRRDNEPRFLGRCFTATRQPSRSGAAWTGTSRHEEAGRSAAGRAAGAA